MLVSIPTAGDFTLAFRSSFRKRISQMLILTPPTGVRDSTLAFVPRSVTGQAVQLVVVSSVLLTLPTP